VDYAEDMYTYDDTAVTSTLEKFHDLIIDRKGSHPVHSSAPGGRQGETATLRLPWSPPGWMKTKRRKFACTAAAEAEYNQTWLTLRSIHQAYAAEGIPMWDSLFQNEALATQVWEIKHLHRHGKSAISSKISSAHALKKPAFPTLKLMI